MKEKLTNLEKKIDRLESDRRELDAKMTSWIELAQREFDVEQKKKIITLEANQKKREYNMQQEFERKRNDEELKLKQKMKNLERDMR